MKKTIKRKHEKLRDLIQDLKKLSKEKEINLWKRIATDLQKSNKKQRVVNLYKISELTKKGDTVIIPGKVLGTGELKHDVTIAAYKFSRQAKDKISDSKGKPLSIDELIKDNPDGKNVRIIG